LVRFVSDILFFSSACPEFGLASRQERPSGKPAPSFSVTFARQGSFMRFATLVLFLFAVSAPASAQEPAPAGRSTSIEAGLGYALVQSSVPSNGQLLMSGVNGTLTVGLTPRFGVNLDFCYAQSGNSFGLQDHNSLMSYLGGPVFYPIERRHARLYVDALFGGARLGGVNSGFDGEYISGYVNRPAWSFGAGAQQQISRRVSIKAGVEYLRASFFDRTGAIQRQSNLRETVTLVYDFGGGHRK
jgi:opacity protein-like surface antigen